MATSVERIISARDVRVFVKYRRTIRNVFLGALALKALLMSYILSISLIAFQKAATIAPVDVIRIDALASNSIGSHRSSPDIRKLLEPIPYQSSKAVFDILPRDRFRKTIQMGYGNCSNLVFGMTFLLLQGNYDFRIVHLMPFDGFLIGAGHTLLDMPYTLDGVARAGMVDVLEGGLPQANNRFIDLPMLREKHLNEPSIVPLNGRKDENTIYYGDFLNNAAVGIVTREEVARYFDFIDRIYIPLGSKRLERVVYSGAAIVFGRYPHTYVSREDYVRLFAGKLPVLWATQILIWLLRLMPLLALLLLISHIPRIKLSGAKVDSAAPIVGKSAR